MTKHARARKPGQSASLSVSGSVQEAGRVVGGGEPIQVAGNLGCPSEFFFPSDYTPNPLTLEWDALQAVQFLEKPAESLRLFRASPVLHEAQRVATVMKDKTEVLKKVGYRGLGFVVSTRDIIKLRGWLPCYRGRIISESPIAAKLLELGRFLAYYQSYIDLTLAIGNEVKKSVVAPSLTKETVEFVSQFTETNEWISLHAFAMFQAIEQCDICGETVALECSSATDPGSFRAFVSDRVRSCQSIRPSQAGGIDISKLNRFGWLREEVRKASGYCVRLASLLGPQLRGIDLQIADVIKGSPGLLAKEIGARIQKTDAVVRQHLKRGSPLAQLGYAVRRKGQGYYPPGV